MTRPSETVSAIIGSVMGALLIVLGAFTDTSKVTPEVAGAIVLLVSWIATAVTYFTSRAQRAGTLKSGMAGEVSS